MNKNGFIHNDIKSDNILYSNDKLYIIDFGSSYSINWRESGKYKPPIASLEDGELDPYFLSQQFEFDKLGECLSNFLNIKIPKGMSIFEIKNFISKIIKS